MRDLRNLRLIVDSRLQPFYLAVISGGVVAISVVVAIVLFFTANRGQTALGIPLGADFAGFYVAAEILNQGQTQQLYDRKRHDQLYHELLPNEDANVSIPYVHPPFVAGLLRLIAWLPYSVAVAIWMVISASLYIVATLLLLRAVPWQDSKQYWLIILLAVSFEPFLMECWMGGQLSAVAFLSYALCFAALQRDKPLWAGMALGLCFYKPTLLILMLPMLLIGRRWQILLGMLYTGIALALLSLLLVGWNMNVGYLNVLLAFSKSTSGGELEIRTWKYVDLNNCLRLAIGTGSFFQRPLLALIGVCPLVLLARSWWLYDQFDERLRRLLWATTLSWVPVLNLYFGIYDSVLVVQSLLITASILCLDSKSATPLISSGFAYLMMALAVVPWFSQSLAVLTGVPIYTLLMMGLGCYQLGLIVGQHPKSYRLPVGSARLSYDE